MRIARIAALLSLLVAVPGAAVADGTESLAGSLLVAAPELGDPNFEQTVVLMLQDDEQGALGVVINRPYGKAPTGELLRRLGVDPGDAKGETELFYGGPVEPEIGMIVHGTDYALPTTHEVASGIAVTSDPKALADIAHGRGPHHAIPVLGYAGWAPGQLASELAQGAWFTLPADPTLVFASDPMQLWKTAYARRGVEL
ncbi:MAG: YqgE/AlgH family protein [Geminicoccaceae bacterium]